MKDKIKVLVLADHPFSPSGVGTQTRYMVEGLLASGQFSFICFGGAVKHEDYSPQKFEKHHFSKMAVKVKNTLPCRSIFKHVCNAVYSAPTIHSLFHIW